MYLAINTRPDILNSVWKLAQRNQNPYVEYEKAVKHILRYMRTTKHLGLQYAKTNELQIGKLFGRQKISTLALHSFWQDVLSAWKVKNGQILHLAEFVALSTAAKEAIYFRRLLKELNCYPREVPIVIYGNNQGAQHLAKNPVFHGRCKHIYVRQVTACERGRKI